MLRDKSGVRRSIGVEEVSPVTSRGCEIAPLFRAHRKTFHCGAWLCGMYNSEAPDTALRGAERAGFHAAPIYSAYSVNHTPIYSAYSVKHTPIRPCACPLNNDK